MIRLRAFRRPWWLFLVVFLLAACATPPPSPTPTLAATFTPLPATRTQAVPTPTATVPPSPSATLTAPPSPSPTTAAPLVPAGRVRAYPGPQHYAGDVLTLEVLLDDFAEEGEAQVTLRLDDGPATQVTGRWQANMLIVPQAVDARDLAGAHTLSLAAANGSLALDESYAFEVLTAAERPAREAQAAWLTTELDCCRVHYITGTAAERDLAQLTTLFQDAAAAFIAQTGAALDEPLDLYFLDRMWGNGAFGGNGELAVVYTDRYYGPGVGGPGLRTLALHEFTHAARIDQNEHGYFIYNEGLAVYIAGGHYKPEPLPERGAALEALGYYSGTWPYPAHEASYLNGAVTVAYVVETFGWDTLWDWVAAAGGEMAFDPAALEVVTQAVFGLSQSEFDAGLAAWRQNHDPAAQVEDLRLTVELQALRRQYQDTYAPPPLFIFGAAAESYALPENLPAVLREPTTLAHVAVELMIANGQAAIASGDYASAEALVGALSETVITGDFAHPLAADYFSAVTALTEQPVEVVGLTFNADTATARVIAAWPAIEEWTLQRADTGWKIAH